MIQYFHWIALSAVLSLCLTSCSQPGYEGFSSLPQKDWLQEGNKKGQQAPAEKRLIFYSPDKVHSFSDLVFLSIQQSPIISRGHINLEIQQISQRDTKWRYLPEMHLLYTISNNITKYNSNNKMKGSDYGQPSYQVSFNGIFNNPVATYFSVQAQNDMMQVAIVTQRKAVGETIRAIADCLLLMNLKEKTIENLKELLAIAQKQHAIAATRESVQPNILAPASFTEDFIQDVTLRIRTAETELALQRSQLKQLVGVDIAQKLDVDTQSVYTVLDSFDPRSRSWQDYWDKTEDRYLLRQQVRLEEANIMLAWAQYMPNISIAINENEPNGQDKPYGGKTDTFAHITFDMPLLDWGHRYRMASISRARKRQSQYDEIQRQREYGQRWLSMEQEFVLAKARAEQRKHAVKSARRRQEVISIAFQNGTADMSTLASFQQGELERRLALLLAQYDIARVRLSWMHMAAGLTHYFLGDSGNGDNK